jgi:hypothetical protein
MHPIATRQLLVRILFLGADAIRRLVRRVVLYLDQTCRRRTPELFATCNTVLRHTERAEEEKVCCNDPVFLLSWIYSDI